MSEEPRKPPLQKRSLTACLGIANRNLQKKMGSSITKTVPKSLAIIAANLTKSATARLSKPPTQ